MSSYEFPSDAARQDPPRRGAWAAFMGHLRGAAKRWQRGRAIAALQALNDRYLENIGVARNEIALVVEDLFGPGRQAVPARLPKASAARLPDAFREAARLRET